MTADNVPEWIAVRKMLHLPEGARPAGDWFKLEKGEAVDGNQYTIYTPFDRVAELEQQLADQKIFTDGVQLGADSLRARVAELEPRASFRDNVLTQQLNTLRADNTALATQITSLRERAARFDDAVAIYKSAALWRRGQIRSLRERVKNLDARFVQRAELLNHVAIVRKNLFPNGHFHSDAVHALDALETAILRERGR